MRPTLRSILFLAVCMLAGTTGSAQQKESDDKLLIRS